MKKFIITLISLFLSVSLAAETVYKTTNPDGSVEFTDQNLKDGEEIKIRETTTFSAPRLPPVSPKKPESTNYKVIIIEPTNDTTIIGNASKVMPVILKLRFQSQFLLLCLLTFNFDIKLEISLLIVVVAP